MSVFPDPFGASGPPRAGAAVGSYPAGSSAPYPTAPDSIAPDSSAPDSSAPGSGAPGSGPATPDPAGRRGLLVPAVALGLAGVTLVVVGTFLPWVESGDRTYRSYAVAGLADRLGFAGSRLVSALVASWPLVGPLCLVPVVLAALRLRRAAGWIAVVVGLLVGSAAATVLGYGARARVPGVAMLATGPWTVIAGGSCMVVAGALALLAGPAQRTIPTSVTNPSPGT